MGRAERRAQERADRARAQEDAERFARTKRGQIMARLERNGITKEELKQNYDIGYEEGHKTAMNNTINVAFAAVCLALHELYGFGQHRCFNVLTKMYDTIVFNLDTKEAIDEVYKQIGLTLNLQDPIQPVLEEEK